jgi:hypothetical protein
MARYPRRANFFEQMQIILLSGRQCFWVLFLTRRFLYLRCDVYVRLQVADFIGICIFEVVVATNNIKIAGFIKSVTLSMAGDD